HTRSASAAAARTMCQAWSAAAVTTVSRSTSARAVAARSKNSTIVLQLRVMNPNWQRASTQVPAAYLRQAGANDPSDTRAKVAYEGLLDVLEPSRRTARLQADRSPFAVPVAPVATRRERRAKHDRRVGERRRVDLGSPSGVERRMGERRCGRDRRRNPRR